MTVIPVIRESIGRRITVQASQDKNMRKITKRKKRTRGMAQVVALLSSKLTETLNSSPTTVVRRLNVIY
jgi:hypothetical protein